MTAVALSHAIAAYPLLLRAAYAGDAVTIAPADARALLALLDSVDAELAALGPPIRTLWDPVLSDADIEFTMPCDAGRPVRAQGATAWERALNRGTGRNAA